MAVNVDASLPVHPLSVDDLEAMVRAGILDEDHHVELLDGVLVEMSPHGERHAVAIRRLNMLLAPIAAAAGTAVRLPLTVEVAYLLPPRPYPPRSGRGDLGGAAVVTDASGRFASAFHRAREAGDGDVLACRGRTAQHKGHIVAKASEPGRLFAGTLAQPSRWIGAESDVVPASVEL